MTNPPFTATLAAATVFLGSEPSFAFDILNSTPTVLPLGGPIPIQKVAHMVEVKQTVDPQTQTLDSRDARSRANTISSSSSEVQFMGSRVAGHP